MPAKPEPGCSTCGGDRVIPIAHRSRDPQLEREEPCPDCTPEADPDNR